MIDLHKSFVFEITKNEASSFKAVTPYYTFQNLSVFIDNPGVSWFFKKGEKYDIFIDGNLYLKETNSIDTESNLQDLFDLVETKALNDALKQIGGGLYNIFIVDKINQKIIIYSDFLGAYPIFYLQNNNKILISGNQFAISEETVPDEISMHEFLKYGYLPFSDSLFMHIKKKNPWEEIELDLASLTVNVKVVQLPVYTPLHQRNRDINTTVSKLYNSLSSFFSRLQTEAPIVGLSGGYDSRLIASFLKSAEPVLFNFGYQNSPEPEIAKQVADVLKLNLINKSIPDNLPSLYGPSLKEQFRIIQSIEYSHVLFLRDQISQLEGNVYVDGFIGGVVLGAAYSYKNERTLIGAYKYLFDKIDFNDDIKTIKNYCDHMYSMKDSILNDIFGTLKEDHLQRRICEKIGNLVNRNVFHARTHTDMIEGLLILTRARNLIAAGPNSISTRKAVACPFIDIDFIKAILSVGKNLFFGNKLYNEMWRRFFPELSSIRKAGQGGTATNCDFTYRLKHVAHIVLHKTKITAIFHKERKDEEKYFSEKDYVFSIHNQHYFNEMIDTSEKVMPNDFYRLLKNKNISDVENHRLFLRLISLIQYLDR